MNLDNKRYKKLFNFAKIICKKSSILPEDLLNDTILHFIERETHEDKLTDSYIFTSLRNRFLLEIARYKRRQNVISQTQAQTFKVNHIPHPIHNETDIDFQEEDNITSSKLKTIEDVILSLRHYEQLLYKLHFIDGISQREIARNINLSHVSINKRINRIKLLVQETHAL